jgi:hypothetical protein
MAIGYDGNAGHSHYQHPPDPLGRVALLARRLPIGLKPRVDNRAIRAQLGRRPTRRRPLAGGSGDANAWRRRESRQRPATRTPERLLTITPPSRRTKRTEPRSARPIMPRKSRATPDSSGDHSPRLGITRGSAQADLPGFLWWDARPRPRLGTVEVRIVVAQSRVPVAAALAAVAQCLVCHHAQAPAVAVAAPELVDENRFLASRDGMQARLIDARSQERRSVRDVLGELLARCAPLADGLDCSAEVAAAATLADDPGDARQRRTVARAGLAELPARLADEFTAATPAPVHA